METVKEKKDNKKEEQTDLMKFANWGNGGEERDQLPILAIENGEEYPLELVSSRQVETKFGPTMMYDVIDLGEGNEEKVFFSKSKRLAYRLLKAEIEPGTRFSLTRTGQGYDTEYDIKKLPV